MLKLKFLNHFIATYFSRDSLNQTLPLLSSLDSNDVNSKTLRQHLRLFFRERGRENSFVSFSRNYLWREYDDAICGSDPAFE